MENRTDTPEREMATNLFGLLDAIPMGFSVLGYSQLAVLVNAIECEIPGCDWYD